MVTVAKSASDKLARIKEDVSTSYKYFQDNYKRFHEFRKYIFKESISEQQRAAMQQLHRPVLEFNILEAYISRLLGEFAQQEPSIYVTPAEGVPIPYEVLNLVEGHIRHILHQADKDSFSYEISSSTNFSNDLFISKFF